jgi:hypothetical protein
MPGPSRVPHALVPPRIGFPLRHSNWIAAAMTTVPVMLAFTGLRVELLVLTNISKPTRLAESLIATFTKVLVAPAATVTPSGFPGQPVVPCEIHTTPTEAPETGSIASLGDTKTAITAKINRNAKVTLFFMLRTT